VSALASERIRRGKTASYMPYLLGLSVVGTVVFVCVTRNQNANVGLPSVQRASSFGLSGVRKPRINRDLRVTQSAGSLMVPAPTNQIDDMMKETGRRQRKRDLLKQAVKGRMKALKNIFQPTNNNAVITVDAKKSKGVDDAALAVEMESGWELRGFGNKYLRTVEIWFFLFNAVVREVKLRKEKDPEVKKMKRMEYAEDLCTGLLKLGPTFIKVGQLLSTRRDVLPIEYIKALERLQDDVPGFSGARAREIIEEDLGKPISEVFSSFDDKPLAAASLGQVHTAILKETGQKVAVKVQRQGLDNLFASDLVNLRLLAVILDKLDPKTDGAQRDWVRIYEESARLLYKEIDYLNEADNAERFAKNFADTPWIKVPSIYRELSSKRVLTMEYVPSIKINDIEQIEKKGIDRKLLAKRSADSYLRQLCNYGFFHCDPHPGNVGCDEKFGGRLVYYDFGMMDEFTVQVRRGFVNLIYSIYENDDNGVCDALEEMGILAKGSDRVSVERITRFFLNEFQGTLSSKENENDAQWINEMTPEEKKKIRKERRAKLGADLFSVGTDVPFKFPPTFTFVFRAFTSLEGIGKGLDKNYDLTRLALPYVNELLKLRDGSAAAAFVKQTAQKLGWRPEDIQAVVTQPRQMKYVSDVIRKLEKGDLKLRVRTIESERAFQRSAMVQSNQGKLLVASALVNAGIALSISAAPALAANAAFGLAAIFAAQFPLGLLKLRSFDKKSKTFGLSS